MSDTTLSSRTVLVTGATSGIGLETARQLAERGATVLLHGRTAEEARAAADRLVATAGIDAGGSAPSVPTSRAWTRSRPWRPVSSPSTLTWTSW